MDHTRWGTHENCASCTAHRGRASETLRRHRACRRVPHRCSRGARTRGYLVCLGRQRDQGHTRSDLAEGLAPRSESARPLRTDVHAAGDGGATRARVRRHSFSSRLLRLSAVAASGNPVDHHPARPAGFARAARPLRLVRGYSGGLHLRFPARTAARGQLRGDRTARPAAEFAGKGFGPGRVSRVSGAHLAGEGAGRGDTNRGQGGHAAQDCRQGGSSRPGIFQEHHRAAALAR